MEILGSRMSTTILGLHGLGSSRRCFDRLFRAGLSQNFETVAFDFSGFGERVHELITDRPLFAAAGEIVQRIKTKQSSRTVLIGHSMGGPVAILVQQAIPQMIDAVILIEGNLIAQDCGLLSRRLASAQGSEQKKVQEELVSMGRNLQNTGWKTWAADAEKTSPETLNNYAKNLVEISDSGKLPEMFNHVLHRLYIHGDDYVGHAALNVLGKNTSIIHMPKTGHFVMEDAPEQCAHVIQSFILEHG